MEMSKQYSFDNIKIAYDQLIYRIGSYHYNWHPEIELLWLITGKIEVNVDGQSYTLEENDLLVINSNCGHATFATVPNSIAMRLHISPEFFTAQGIDVSEGRFELNSSKEPRNPRFQMLRKDLSQLQLLNNETRASMLKNNALLFKIAELLFEFFLPHTKRSGYSVGQKRVFLDHAVQFIEENCNGELTLEQLAKECNYSTTYLSKIFKTELGINFYEYLTRCRLQKGIRTLTMTDKKVATISYETGFSDVKAFNKAFRKHFGTTPSEYRKQIDSDIREIDRTFKTTLNEEKKEIEERLVQYQQSNNLFQNPCLNCNSKEYEAKYYELVANIRQIVE
ncbi:hypothetical protein P009_01606 [Enterococcus faecalis EnGen0409]|nr:hypothetical protein P009_01606 [Enterococcus faecalis EnGen0409]HCD9885774.1 helix-turn-helix transcriptional regulator [Enterococcus faecium]